MARKSFARNLGYRFSIADKTVNITAAFPLQNDLIALVGSDGHIGVINVRNREPVWHAQLSEQLAIAPRRIARSLQYCQARTLASST